MDEVEMCETVASSKKSAIETSNDKCIPLSRQDYALQSTSQEVDKQGSSEMDINQNQKLPENATGKDGKEEEDTELNDGLTEEEYEVEKILKRRRTEDGKAWLFVKWLGWDNRFNTWEAEDRMDEVEQYEHFLKNFEEKRFLPPGTKGANVKGFDRSFLAESILGSKSDDGKHLLLVKWKEVDFTEWVPAEDADSCCPRMVIDFYEKYILWSNPSSDDPKVTSNQATTSAPLVDKSPGKATAA